MASRESEKKKEMAPSQEIDEKKKMASSQETTTAAIEVEKTRELFNMLGAKLDDDPIDRTADSSSITSSGVHTTIKGKEKLGTTGIGSQGSRVDDGVNKEGEKVVSSERKSSGNPESAETQVTAGMASQETDQMKNDGEKKASVKGKGKIDDQESAGIKKEDEEVASSERKSSPTEEQQESVLLFEKKLQSADVNPNMRTLVIGDCADLLRWTTLFEEVEGEIACFLRVMTQDQNGAEYELHFMPYSASGRYYFYNQWAEIVAANGLQKGDTVAGWGGPAAGKSKMTLIISKEGEEVVSSERESSSPPPPVFLFGKVVDKSGINAVGLERVMVTRYSEVVERAMAEEEERNPERFYRFVSVMGKDPRGAEWELRLTRFDDEGHFVVGHHWRQLFVENKLDVGDRLEGWGNHCATGFKAIFHIFRLHHPFGTLLEEADDDDDDDQDY